jgi:hypothetical protein
MLRGGLGRPVGNDRFAILWNRYAVLYAFDDLLSPLTVCSYHPYSPSHDSSLRHCPFDVTYSIPLNNLPMSVSSSSTRYP